MADPTVVRWRDMMRAGGAEAARATSEMVRGHARGTNPAVLSDPAVMGPILRRTWLDQLTVADGMNEPGTFTALIGYEYSSTPNGNNLHRVVLYRDGADLASRSMPFSSNVSEDPEALWASLAEYEARTGGKVLAIPHNPNLSGGQMFALADFEGNPLTADYAERRSRWEPIVEVTQIKGDSEAHPFLSPNDEFAGFGVEGWEEGNLIIAPGRTPQQLAGEYAREALKRGLSVEAETGMNPYKFGMIGSTDSHTALATADEHHFHGKTARFEPSAERATQVVGGTLEPLRVGWHFLASGYAAVWAEENTREALFDAMMRKEVYATTGPRIELRVFGGRDFTEEDASAVDLAAVGYARGVPMGGDILPGDGPPTLLIDAKMDPEGGHLDRVQVIKGWLDADGAVHERIYDAAWSDGRVPGPDGKLPPVGDTVDLSVPTFSNTIGSPRLTTVWTDPDHSPGEPAFYYVRVIEIPTPRWTAYDAVRFGHAHGSDVTLKSQERAYSSPLWTTR